MKKRRGKKSTEREVPTSRYFKANEPRDGSNKVCMFDIELVALFYLFFVGVFQLTFFFICLLSALYLD